MGDRSSHPNSGGGSGNLLSGMAGALLGAAGLAWWLLSEAEKRRLTSTRSQGLRPPGSQQGGRLAEAQLDHPLTSAQGQKDLHDKVHELNQAIDDVRRQLEGMATSR